MTEQRIFIRCEHKVNHYETILGMGGEPPPAGEKRHLTIWPCNV